MTASSSVPSTAHSVLAEARRVHGALLNAAPAPAAVQPPPPKRSLASDARRLRRGRSLPAYRPKGRIFRVDRSKWWFRDSAWFRVSDIPLQTVITGATGSGKTSCVVHTIVRQGTRCGVPFLVYCAKQEDAADFNEYINSGGGFAITVSPTGQGGGPPPYVFPFLRYLEDRNVATLDIVEVIMSAMNALDGGRSSMSGEQSFWDKSMRVVLARVITLLRASSMDFSLPNLMRAMGGLPIKGAKAPFFAALMQSAQARSSEGPVHAALRYFAEEFRTLEPRTSGSIRAVWSAMAAELEQAPLDRLLAEPVDGQLVVTPSTVLDDRIPVILDLPTLVYPRSGGVFQALFHQCLKIALHQRAAHSHVVGIVQDEFQASVPSRKDLTDIMTTARSKGVGGIYATQALSNVMAVYGREDARAIFGTPNMLIACRNDDSDTKQFVSERSGERYEEVESTTEKEEGGSISVTRREEKRAEIVGFELSELKRPSKKQWRPRAETLVLRDGQTFRVSFDRMVPSPVRVLRGLVAWVFDHDNGGWKGIFDRLGQVAVATTLLLIFTASVVLFLVAVRPQIVATCRILLEDAVRLTSTTPTASARSVGASARSVGAVAPMVHVVRRGDTVSAIAERYGISVSKLVEANALRSIDRIEVDQTLLIPEAQSERADELVLEGDDR